jgi:hypothetical protein
MPPKLRRHFKSADHFSKLLNVGHMIESADKITLVNNDFIVWIIPETRRQIPSTYTLIALNNEVRDPQLEVVFVASGVYNTSRLVLKVLEKFLMEIQETENVLDRLR